VALWHVHMEQRLERVVELVRTSRRIPQSAQDLRMVVHSVPSLAMIHGIIGSCTLFHLNFKK